jgi:hypothetical protein
MFAPIIGSSSLVSVNQASWGSLRDFVIFEERIRQNLENVASLRNVLWRRLQFRSCILMTLIVVALRLAVMSWKPSSRIDLVISSLLVIGLAIMMVLTLSAAAGWRRAVACPQYEGQCQKCLAPFNMQIRLLPSNNASKWSSSNFWIAKVSYQILSKFFSASKTIATGEITFLRRLPRQLAIFLEAYAEYRARRALRQTPSANKKHV